MRAAANANNVAADVNRSATDASPPPGQPTEEPAQHVSLMLNSPGTVIAGTTFQVPLVLTGGTDVAAVPVQVQYDPSKLALVNVGDGDFLNRDGQIVAMAHRDDGPGEITLNASRPPGAPGVSGAGVLCVLTFQAKCRSERHQHYPGRCHEQCSETVAGTNLAHHHCGALGVPQMKVSAPNPES